MHKENFGCIIALCFGKVAQLVEQRTENPCVGSSILPLATKILPGTGPGIFFNKNYLKKIVWMVYKKNAAGGRGGWLAGKVLKTYTFFGVTEKTGFSFFTGECLEKNTEFLLLGGERLFFLRNFEQNG